MTVFQACTSVAPKLSPTFSPVLLSLLPPGFPENSLSVKQVFLTSQSHTLVRYWGHCPSCCTASTGKDFSSKVGRVVSVVSAGALLLLNPPSCYLPKSLCSAFSGPHSLPAGTQWSSDLGSVCSVCLLPVPLQLFQLNVSPPVSLDLLGSVCCGGAWESDHLLSAFQPLVLAQMLCPLSSKAFSFWFSKAFSSLKSLPLAFQKLWLSKVLFQIWDQGLVLEVRTEHCFFLCFKSSHSPSGSVGALLE